jgi:hypothetical protein
MNYDELKKKHPELNWAEAENADPEELEAAAELFDKIAKQKRQEYLNSLVPKEFNPKVWPSDDTPYNTSFIGYLDTSFENLIRHFGLPNGIGDDYKVSTKWILHDYKGRIITIYDYKETNLYSDENPSVEEFRRRKSYQWHIGGTTPEAAQLLVEIIESDKQ